MPTYLITGTSSGIGKAAAEYLLSHSSSPTVIGIARRTVNFDSPNYTHIRGDISNPEIIQKLLTVTQDRLDGVLFNAGLLDAVDTVANAKVDEWKHVFDINFFSIVSLSSLLLPLIKQSRGRFIFVSSGASKSSYKTWGAYGASKAALNHFAMTLATENPDIISVSVAPGVVNTDMQTRIREELHTKMPEDMKRKFFDLYNEGKLVKVEDSGKLMANLVIGATKELSGEYFRYNDDKLAAFR